MIYNPLPSSRETSFNPDRPNGSRYGVAVKDFGPACEVVQLGKSIGPVMLREQTGIDQDNKVTCRNVLVGLFPEDVANLLLDVINGESTKREF